MRKETSYKIVSGLLLTASPLIVLAAITAPFNFNVKTALEGVFNFLGYAGMILGVGFIALGIFKLITSKGDPRALDEAKVDIFWGIVAAGIGALLITSITTILGWFGIT